jgi:plastocyanin
MPDWSIKIEGKPAVFTPDIDNIKPGTPLKVVQGDLVSWNNESDEPHFLVPEPVTDPVSGQQKQLSPFMTAPLAPGNPSGAYNVVEPSGTTISYHCSLHDNERGQIVVVDFGASDYGPEDLIA